MTDSERWLNKYARERDAESFAALAGAHAGMVYQAGFRITGNAAEAEDVAQESFLELARNAGRLKGNIGAWLHTVATRKALDAVRAKARRVRHESAAVGAHSEKKEADWSEILPLVDEAIEKLPAELREALVMHYLEGKSQAAVAEELGISQPTVSRRIDGAVSEIRDRLGKAGIVVTALLITGALSSGGAQAAPAGLVAAIGKMGIAGVGKSAAAGAAATGGVLTMKTLITVILVTGAIFLTVELADKPLPPEQPAAQQAAAITPVPPPPPPPEPAKPISAENVDRLVKALWTAPPPLAEPPCGLQIQLVRESFNEPGPRDVAEAQFRKAYEQSKDALGRSGVTLESFVRENMEGWEKQKLPYFYRETVLLVKKGPEQFIRIDQTKLNDLSDPSTEVTDILAEVGDPNKPEFRSYSVHRSADPDVMGIYWISKRQTGLRLSYYAGLGGIQDVSGLQAKFSKILGFSNNGKVLMEQDPARIAAYAAQNPPKDMLGGDILWQDRVMDGGRKTVVVSFMWPPVLPPGIKAPNDSTTPVARLVLDSDDLRRCYREEGFFPNGLLQEEYIAEGFSPVEGTNWAFPKKFTSQKFSQDDHRVTQYEKITIERVTAMPDLSAEDFIPAVPDDCMVTNTN